MVEGSICTLNIYLDANTKYIDTKFLSNLKSPSKKTFQWSLLKMTTFCLHKGLQTFAPVINRFTNHG